MKSTNTPPRKTQHPLGEEYTSGFLSLILQPYVRKGLLTPDLLPAPGLNNQQKSMLAHDIAKRFNMHKFCPFFEKFWGLKNLSHNNYKYSNGSKCVIFAKLLKEIK